MADIKNPNDKIAQTVVEGYQKIETGVVDGYKKIENAFVGGYQKIENAFVNKFLARDGETAEEAKARINGKADKEEE